MRPLRRGRNRPGRTAHPPADPSGRRRRHTAAGQRRRQRRGRRLGPGRPARARARHPAAEGPARGAVHRLLPAAGRDRDACPVRVRALTAAGPGKPSYSAGLPTRRRVSSGRGQQRRGQVQRRILALAVAAAAAILVAAVTLASGASAGEPAAVVELKPQPVHPVTPRQFHGDLRRIPRGNVVQPEERPAARSPRENPPSTVVSDPARQAVSPAAAAPSPSSNFPGLDFAGWGAGWPPDTNGDVGPTYFIQTVNTSVGIFDKATGNRVAAFTFNSLFSQSPTGTPCDNSNQGDPVALYDPIGDRWIVTDFAWSNYTSGAMYQCMAVSKTSNPVTGGWYFYAWQTESGGVIPDYPKLGVWPDGIYM